jgi:hypothetical protein
MKSGSKVVALSTFIKRKNDAASVIIAKITK